MGAALPKPSFDAVDESRIDATLRGMSLDEKLGQMWQVDWRTMRPRPRGCASVPWLGRLMEMVVNLLPGCLGLGLGLGLGFLLEDAPLLARRRVGEVSIDWPKFVLVDDQLCLRVPQHSARSERGGL